MRESLGRRSAPEKDCVFQWRGGAFAAAGKKRAYLVYAPFPEGLNCVEAIVKVLLLRTASLEILLLPPGLRLACPVFSGTSFNSPRTA